MRTRPVLTIACSLTVAMGAPAPVRAEDQPSPAVQDQIETFLQPGIVNPETADWRFLFSRPYLGGTLWCGQVNLMNSAKIYMGFHPFYATIFSDGVRQATILGGRRDDPLGAVGQQLRLICGF